jgi:hypothetical protein
LEMMLRITLMAAMSHGKKTLTHAIFRWFADDQ